MFFDSVIFDLDNTLYNYDTCHDEAVKKSLEKISELSNIGKELIKSEYLSVSKKLKLELNNTAASHNRFIYFKIILSKLNRNIDVKIINDIYWSEFYKNIKLEPNVEDLLVFLKNNKIKCYILTDYTIEHQYEKLNKLNILNYFDDVFTSEEIGIEKPSLKAFSYCLNKIKSNNCIFIGDSYEKDIEGSINSGIFPFHYIKSSKFEIMDRYAKFGNFQMLLDFFIRCKKTLEELEHLGKYFGQRFDLTQAGGGNISIKDDSILFIKSSGVKLSDMNQKGGYSIINLNRLKEDVLNNIYKEINSYNIILDNRASMETYMHSYLKKYTIHLHPIQCNRVLCREDANKICSDILENYCLIDYVTPGIELSRNILSKNYNGNFYALKNHGVIYTTDNFENLIEDLEDILLVFENNSKIDLSKYRLVNKISNYFDQKLIVYLSEDTVVNKITEMDILFPDMIVFCGFETIFCNMDNIESKIKLYNDNYNESPKIIIFDSKIYIISNSLNKCMEIESVIKSQILIYKDNSNLVKLNDKDCREIINLDSEKYRINLC